MKFYLNSSTDPAFNLALEETLAAEEKGDGFFMLWRNAPAVIVGRNQNTAAEINAGYVRRHHIQVVRRITGGGAVYHDLGNLNYTIAAPGRSLAAGAFAELADPVVRVLRRLGVPAEWSGRNDILVEGRKVSGSARSVLRETTLFHGTLLFDVDLEILSEALRPDPDKIRSKGVRSVRARVANLREFMPGWTMPQFMAELERGLSAELGAAAAEPPPPSVLAAAEQLAERKYRSREWNYHTAFPYDWRVRKRFAAGTVELTVAVSGNRVVGLRFSGDFFGEAPVEELAARLVGAAFTPEEIAARLTGIDPGRFIAGLSAAELLELFDFA